VSNELLTEDIFVSFNIGRVWWNLGTDLSVTGPAINRTEGRVTYQSPGSGKEVG
jgi:hypothetical protein